MESIYEQIAALLERRGDEAYVGEPVSQKEHALQAAYQSAQNGDHDTLIVAALLHDIGHLLVADADGGEAKAAAGIDTRHEDLGEAWLSTYFPPAVTEPVRLHVAAKRYLCATEPGYLGKLSPASVRSLELQGGPMNADEIAAFQSNPHYTDAIRLRHYDDEAKIEGLPVPGIAAYQAQIEGVVLSA